VVVPASVIVHLIITTLLPQYRHLMSKEFAWSFRCTRWPSSPPAVLPRWIGWLGLLVGGARRMVGADQPGILGALDYLQHRLHRLLRLRAEHGHRPAPAPLKVDGVTPASAQELN
jgi:hypothetical protein